MDKPARAERQRRIGESQRAWLAPHPPHGDKRTRTTQDGGQLRDPRATHSLGETR
ncbi:hypothetical protein [Iningainema tapete]|uniref:Uncharacterized protein n=1 Tax=Iningainema tapete BLCC-T55 TaxID=2748662 RepID=A0A8J6X9V0_9CYAN|nr:hypothetical protein [Iningainema tapete]MBD2770630.1 hypothetical protein [Iningainema tapete BLCC-T55]